MGADRDVHDEAKFFKEFNQYLFRLAHAAWDYPEPMMCLLQNQQLRLEIVDFLKREITSLNGLISYWGIVNSWRALSKAGSLWGWKDPRNSYTLPIWLDIFPNAKVIHIYRNGIDVAASLKRREFRRKNRLHNSLLSCRCMNLVGAFDLWVEYVSRCFSIMNSLPDDQTLQIQYESFLRAPEKNMHRIAVLLETEPQGTCIIQVQKRVRADKAYAFVSTPELRDFYEAKRHHPLMVELGYDELDV